MIKPAYIKSPLNYIGGKGKLLSQILPLFPNDVACFVDLFCGGGNVGVNINASKVVLNDNLSYLIQMYQMFQEKGIDDVLGHIENRIEEYNLSLTNENAYKSLRNFYNKEKNPLDLFVLIAYSFNHQIRFNNSHEFNNPFGRERSSFNPKMKENLKRFIQRIQKDNYTFVNYCFTDFDFSNLTKKDFVYADPPYLITTGTYNDGKRGFKGWGEKEEYQLLEVLDTLNKKNIKFALSNVLEHKGKNNEILKKWIEKNNYQVNYLDYNYANSNYQTANRSKTASVEVLITNYAPIIKHEPNLFNIQ